MAPNSNPLAMHLADWAATLRYRDLPQAVVTNVRRSLLDHLGVTLGGASAPIARNVRTYIAQTEGGTGNTGNTGGAGRASVIGTGLMMSPANAAFANGTAAAVLELDEGHALAPIHVGGACLPAILATAQARGVADGSVIVATAIAYEIAVRLTVAVGTAAARGFNCTALTGIFGAAIGAARLMQGDAGVMAQALGIAGSNTGGLYDYHGGWLDTWCLNVGRTAREGLICAALAERGIAGPVDILDGPRGIGDMFNGGGIDRDTVLNGLGRDWLAMQTYIKIYPCCRILHTVIDGVLALREETGADVEAIESVVVETTAESARLNATSFGSTTEAQMSIPYAVATTFVFGLPGLEHFGDSARRDPRIGHLVDRVEVVESDDPAIAGRRLSSRVTVTAAGRTRSVTVEEPTGNPRKPVGSQMLERKFLGLAKPVIGQDAAQRVAASVWSMDGDSDALPAIAELIRGGPTAGAGAPV